jgi:4-amino-4-deoxy-L-arabinose transferase-like glycosyltransferase
MSVAEPTSDGAELRWVSIALLVLVAIRVVAAALIPLSPDETYYLSWSRFLAWSYYDHPPMVAWWIRGGTALLGENPLGVRLFTVASTIPTSLAVYFTGKILFDRRTGVLGVLFINATLLIGVGSISATPDAPSVMFWALGVVGFALVAKTGNDAWWLAVGVAAGLGVASKLTDLFLGLGILLSLAASRNLRHWLLSPWLWAGGVAAALIFSPVFLWNAHHEWITFAKQFGRIDTGSFQPEKFPEFIVTQFAVLNPLIAIFVGLAAVAWVKRNRVYPLAGLDPLIWTTVPLVAYMVVHSFHEQIQAHWLAPIFPTLALVAAAVALAAPPERWAGGRALVFPVGVGLSLLGLVLAANPDGILPFWLDAGQVIRGWDDVAAEADALRLSSGATWIGTNYYGVLGELQYHLRAEGVPVIGIAERQRYTYAPSPDPALLHQPVLLVTTGSLPEAFSECFTDLAQIGTIARRSGGQTIEELIAYRATGATAAAFDPGCDAR